MNRKLEICCGDIESVVNAVAGGADRIELCSALEIGGVTPSIGLVKEAVRLRRQAAVHVLIRPRGGDFLYTPEEIDCMVSDILACRHAGAQGVVIGALNADGSVDAVSCKRMVEAAEGLSVTFHRAFDLCADPFEALEIIINLGCHRILTSGCAPTAADGIETLCRLNDLADNRIILLGGSGVNPSNASRILEETGLAELHASARSKVDSRMTFRHPGVAMGSPDSDEYTRYITDKSIVKQLATIIH